jgi:hypothetical protein
MIYPTVWEFWYICPSAFLKVTFNLLLPIVYPVSSYPGVENFFVKGALNPKPGQSSQTLYLPWPTLGCKDSPITLTRIGLAILWIFLSFI